MAFHAFAWLFEKMTRHSVYVAERNEQKARAREGEARVREATERTREIEKRAPALEACRRSRMVQALAALPGEPHVKAVLVDLYAIGGKRALEAIERAIDDHPMGRSYLSLHIGACERSDRSARRDWRTRLRQWSAQELGSGQRTVPRHSGSMTNIRFMLAIEGFATLVEGAVTIDPGFVATLGPALESVRDMIDEEDS